MRVVDYTKFYGTALSMLEKSRHYPLYLRRGSKEIPETREDSLTSLIGLLEMEVEGLNHGPLKPRLERDILQLKKDLDLALEKEKAMSAAMGIELKCHYAEVLEQLDLAERNVRYIRRIRSGKNYERTKHYLENKLKVIELYIRVLGKTPLTAMMQLELEGIRKEIDERDRVEFSFELPN